MTEELRVGDKVIHRDYGAGIVLQLWQGKAVVQLAKFGKGGVVTVGVFRLTLQAPLPDLEKLSA